MSLGWPGPNGDLFRDTAKKVLKQEAYSFAKSALEVPESATIFEPTADQAATCARVHPVGISNKREVVTDLEESWPWKNWEDDTEPNTDESHRGRAKVHELQSGLQAELLGGENIKEFWDFLRQRTDLRPKKAKVSLNALARDSARMAIELA
ncbi:hypothetical protein B0H19DRAFT_1073974 [Mycena capillaripes]|nr:hypothetical protein B0H19DRAFT_1073974 [Mycena capillaripes]